MRRILLIAMSAIAALAQQPEAKVDAKLHADVLKLAEVAGIRQSMEASLPMMIGQSKGEVTKRCPACKPEFAAEWVKRMTARVRVDELVAVAVRAYEKNLPDETVLQLTAVLKEKKETGKATVPDDLKQKINAAMPTIMSEIMGGCTQIGAKLGAEVAQEIGKEHPEWVAEEKPAK